MLRAPFLALALAVTSVPGHAVPTSVGLDDRDIAGLLNQIKSRRDRVSPILFLQLARMETEQSLVALLEGLTYVKDLKMKRTGYSLLGTYTIGKRYWDLVPIFLSEEALEHRDPDVRQLAAKYLGVTGNLSRTYCLDVLIKSDEPGVDAEVARHALDLLVERADVESLEIMLGHLRAGRVAMHSTGLGAFQSEETTARMLDYLTQKRADDAWRVLLVDTLVPRAPEGLADALSELVGARDPRIQAQVLDALGALGRLDDRFDEHLARMRAAKDEQTRAAGIRITSRWRGDDAWLGELLALAVSSEPEDRVAAALGLEYSADERASAALGALLADSDQRVRATAIALVGRTGRRDLLAAMIARVEEEEGRLLLDTVDALGKITGQRYGSSFVDWSRWFEKNGSDFPPPEANAVEATASREADVQLFDLPVHSRRLCFVLDTGSSTSDWLRDDDGSQPSRLAFAVEHLSQLTEDLDGKPLVNFVFVGEKPETWQRRAVAFDSRKRRNALRSLEKLESGVRTDFVSGIERALSDPEIDTIYLVGTGANDRSDPVLVRHQVRWLNSTRGVRFHALAIGAQSPLLRWIAEDSGGSYAAHGLKR